MSEYKTSEAQRRASKKWDKENRRYKTIRGYRANGLNYIKNYATREDLVEYEKVITARRLDLDSKE